MFRGFGVEGFRVSGARLVGFVGKGLRVLELQVWGLQSRVDFEKPPVKKKKARLRLPQDPM